MTSDSPERLKMKHSSASGPLASSPNPERIIPPVGGVIGPALEQLEGAAPNYFEAAFRARRDPDAPCRQPVRDEVGSAAVTGLRS